MSDRHRFLNWPNELSNAWFSTVSSNIQMFHIAKKHTKVTIYKSCFFNILILSKSIFFVVVDFFFPFLVLFCFSQKKNKTFFQNLFLPHFLIFPFHCYVFLQKITVSKNVTLKPLDYHKML